MSDSSSASKKSVRLCPNCKVRMSSLELDPHRICVSCRGISCCMNERCDVCLTWDEGKMSAYLRHQASLKRKREHKQKMRVKSNVPDFATICTGIQDADMSLSDDARSRDGGADEAISSVAGSASLQDVSRLVREEVATMGQNMEIEMTENISSNVNSRLDVKLEMFSANMLQYLNDFRQEMRDISGNNVTNNSFSAPKKAAGQRPNGRQSPPISDHPKDSHSQGAGKDGPHPSDLESSLPPNIKRSLKAYEDLF